MTPLETALLANMDRFVGFARNRIADPDLAMDVVQESLLKAVRAAPDIDEEEQQVAWFFRVLRNTLTDLYRRRGTEARALERYGAEPDPENDPELHATACGCFEDLLPAMKPEYQEVLRALELGDDDPEDVATRLGITRNNLKVRRHRARAQLRQRLEDACGICAVHGCLDCKTC